MKASRWTWLGSACIGLAALAPIGAAHADDARPAARASGSISRLDLLPPGAMRGDPTYSPGIDYTPTGSTAPPRKTSATAKPSVEPPDLSPSAFDAPDALARAPLPPDVPPVEPPTLPAKLAQQPSLDPAAQVPAPAPPTPPLSPAAAAALALLTSSHPTSRPPNAALDGVPPPAEGTLALLAPAARPVSVAPPATKASLDNPAPAAAPPATVAPAIATVPPPSSPEAASTLGAPPDPAAPSPAAPGPPVDADLAVALQTALAAYVDGAAHARTQLDASPVREAVQAFYTDRLNAPLWVDLHGLTTRGRETLARLRRAGEDGIDIAVARLPQDTIAPATPASLAEAETALSAAAVSYALQASGGRASPWAISSQVTAHAAVADPAKALAALAQAENPGEVLLGYNPPQRGYRELRDELARMRGDSPVATGPVLRVGMTDPRVKLIRSRFGLGALSDVKTAEVYDSRVASAVMAFQRVHGLSPDGALTIATSEALFGAPTSKRAALVLANMEMWRWEPREMGQTRVEVNVPDYTLRVFDGDDEVHRARVIVGKPDTPTPIFSNEIRYILLNPIWRVPDSIIKKEMAPKLASDPGYLTRRGFKVTRVGDRVVVEQPPGEGNALGRILFMFPNEHAVYLHDTPTRGLFATTRRAYSHGCVRVEDPAELAELFMGGAAHGWTAQRVQAMVGTSERTVFLPKPLPIHIQYFTEFVDDAGELQEREDVYGLTAKVAAILSQFRQY